jgi:hypothetical protein
MPVTVGVNNISVVHKSKGGITIAFPDVCKTPAPIGMVPIPYPNIAKTAAAKQKTKTVGGVSLKVGSKVSISSGDEAGRVGGIVSAKNMGKTSFKMGSSKVVAAGVKVMHMGAPAAHNGAAKKTEAQQLRGRLATLTAKLQNLTSKDPAQWQSVLQDYAVTASALYVTLNDDD